MRFTSALQTARFKFSGNVKQASKKVSSALTRNFLVNLSRHAGSVCSEARVKTAAGAGDAGRLGHI